MAPTNMTLEKPNTYNFKTIARKSNPDVASCQSKPKLVNIYSKHNDQMESYSKLIQFCPSSHVIEF